MQIARRGARLRSGPARAAELAGARPPGPRALDRGGFGAGVSGRGDPLTGSPGGLRPEAPEARERRRASRSGRQSATATTAPSPRPERRPGDRHPRR